ncbi:hypothetical protein INR49_011625 [Caranx melampygus]|nr:hypothetical protein INR49_011625 [Caranx melampygus]
MSPEIRLTPPRRARRRMAGLKKCVALKRAVGLVGREERLVYLELVYLVTAFVPSDTACLASSPAAGGGQRSGSPGGDGGALVVVSQTRGLTGNTLEDIAHKGIHYAHGLGGDTGVRVDLFEDLVDVDGIALLPGLPLLLAGLRDALRHGLLGALLRCGLTAEAVESAALSLESINDIHGGDGLPLGVLSVGDGVTNDVLQEDFEHPAGLLVDEPEIR